MSALASRPTATQVGRLVAATSKPWEMNGEKGVAHRVWLATPTDVVAIKIPDAGRTAADKLIGREVAATCTMFAKGNRIDYTAVRLADVKSGEVLWQS